MQGEPCQSLRKPCCAAAAPAHPAAPWQSGQAAERGQKSVALRPHLCSSSTRPRAPWGASYSRSCPSHVVRVGVSSGCPAAFLPPAAATAAALLSSARGRTPAADSASSTAHRQAAAPAIATTRRRRRGGAPAAWAAAGLRRFLAARRDAASLIQGAHGSAGLAGRRGARKKRRSLHKRTVTLAKAGRRGAEGSRQAVMGRPPIAQTCSCWPPPLLRVPPEGGSTHPPSLFAPCLRVADRLCVAICIHVSITGPVPSITSGPGLPAPALRYARAANRPPTDRSLS